MNANGGIARETARLNKDLYVMYGVGSNNLNEKKKFY